MSNTSLPRSNLKRLKKEVLDLSPVSALPCNFPEHWLHMIARDLQEVMNSDDHGKDEAKSYASAPLALIIYILKEKSPDPINSISLEMCWDYFVDLNIEINLEILNRMAIHKSVPATIETIFTNRQIQII